MANLSQIFRNGQALQAKAGPMAINQNDLVALGGYPVQLYPVQNSDCAAVATAGQNAIATTTVTGGTNYETRDRALLDPDTLDLFFADTNSGSGGTAQGCQVWKYNSAGLLLRTTKLDDSGGTMVLVQAKWLTNGNILVVWNQVATPYSIFFAILDKALNIIVPKTLIASVTTNPQANLSCCALANGGFAIAYAAAGVGSYFAVRNAVGAAVYGPTLIAGGPTNSSGNSAGPRFKLATLSNGNVFVGIHDTSQGSDIGRYCIFTPTGGIAKGYTVLAGYGSGYMGYPEVEVMPGFVCMALNAQRAYVFDNAGNLQGVPQQLAVGNGSVRVKTDGTYFWVFSTGQNSSGGMTVHRLQGNGSVVVTSTPQPSSLYADALYERGQFVIFDGTKAYIVIADAAGNATVAASTTFSSGSQTIGGVGDFCAVVLGTGTFAITKYLNASIIGIAQTAVAAGNAGTLVSINQGPGGYITNEYKGTPGKSFDHSAAPIAGGKGAMYLNSVSFKGQ